MTVMKIMMRTMSSDEHGFNADYDYGVVEVDERVAKIIAGHVSLFKMLKKTHPSMVELTFRDEHCYFYPSSLLMDENMEKFKGMSKEEQDHLENLGWVVLSEEFELPAQDLEHSPEGQYLVVCGEGFFNWRTYPTGTSIEIDSESMTPEVLARIL